MTTDELIDELHRAAGRTSAPEPFDLGTVLAGGERRLRARRRRRLAAGGGFAVACAAAAVAAGLHWLPGPAQVATPAETPAPEIVVNPMTPEAQAAVDQIAQVVGYVAGPQQPEDVLPLAVTQRSAVRRGSGLPLVDETSRYLGRVDDSDYWLAVTQNGAVCTVHVRDAPGYQDDSVSIGCGEARLFVASTITQATAFGGGAGPARRQIWPMRDGQTLTPEEAEIWTMVTPRLAVAHWDPPER